MEMLHVLIIENDRAIQAAVKRAIAEQPVVEQFIVKQLTIEQMLEASDLTVETFNATDLATAITELENYPFDCILLNTISLEDTSLQLLHELAASTQSTPMVVITEQAEPQTMQCWQNAGVAEVLLRSSLTPALLAHTLRYVIRLHRAEERARLAAQRLRDNDQLLLRQYQVIEKQEQQIQQLNSQLLEASQLKSQFLATVSHELRTPMNAIIGFSQLLQRERELLSLRQANMVNRILSNAKHLLGSINEILDFSRIQAGQLALKQDSVNLVHLIRATTEELQTVAAHKHLSFEVHLDLPDSQIVTDCTYLQQILFNLISNAIKFTAAGSIKVEAKELDSNRVAIIVRDTGIGIKPADLERIFEPFRQVDQTASRDHSGIGLGLAVTAALVQRMQGRITVKSAIGKGSEFQVELPRQLVVPPLSKIAVASSGC